MNDKALTSSTHVETLRELKNTKYCILTKQRHYRTTVNGCKTLSS